MKQTILIWIIFLSIFTVCFADTESSNIFTLQEFQKSPHYKERVDGIFIKESDLALLKGASIEEELKYEENPIVLAKSLDDVLKILDDKNFGSEYNVSELTLFVYSENRVVMEFCHNDEDGFSCQKELAVLEGKSLNRKSLGVIYGSFASSEEEKFEKRIINDHNNTRFWKCR
jgi:hypothetical protein